MEKLQELQRYAERLQFEATCARLWSNGIQDQIMEETQKVQTWISRMIGELNRLRRVQPAWVQQLQAKANQQPQPSIAPSAAPAPVPAQSASSSSAPGIPVKAAPTSKNPSMAILWRMLRGMRLSQTLQELIHGQHTSLGPSDPDRCRCSSPEPVRDKTEFHSAL